HWLSPQTSAITLPSWSKLTKARGIARAKSIQTRPKSLARELRHESLAGRRFDSPVADLSGTRSESGHLAASGPTRSCRGYRDFGRFSQSDRDSRSAGSHEWLGHRFGESAASTRGLDHSRILRIDDSHLGK